MSLYGEVVDDKEEQKPLQAMPVKTTYDSSSYAATQMALVKMQFIRKVYTVLSLQLLLTTLVSAVTCLYSPVRHYVVTNPFLLTVACVLSIVMLVALLCYKDKYPTNLILLAAWTTVEAYTVGVVTASYADRGQGLMVVQAAGLTMFIFLVLTAYTCTSKTDFSFMGPMLFSCLMGMILYSLIGWIFHLPMHGLVYSCFGALLFSGYIVYDTHMICNRYGPDDWIIGAIDLYLDIINLFLYILQILASRRD